MTGYIASCVRIGWWISLVVVEWVGGGGGGEGWTVLGDSEGIKERVQRTDGFSEDQGVVLWASSLQVVVKNCKFQRTWHWMKCMVMEPACSNNAVALVTSSRHAMPFYCYHTKLLSSMLHSYPMMILEGLLLVPGLDYGVWWPWIVLPKQQGPHLSLINKIQGETGNYSWSWLGYRMCWKESNICTLGTPRWHSFLIHFIVFSICRCRNCRQKMFDIMVSLPLVTGGWPSHSVELLLSKATGFKAPVTNLSPAFHFTLSAHQKRLFCQAWKLSHMCR